MTNKIFKAKIPASKEWDSGVISKLFENIIYTDGSMMENGMVQEYSHHV